MHAKPYKLMGGPGEHNKRHVSNTVRCMYHSNSLDTKGKGKGKVKLMINKIYFRKFLAFRI